MLFAYCNKGIGRQSLSRRLYWPSAVANAHEVVWKCSNCQRHAPYSKFPPDEVQLLPPVWPLARWGIDIVGPLPTAPGNYKYAAVAVEYFSKWVEAKALRDITAGALQKFYWQNIVCRFEVPKEVTVDNGKQFAPRLETSPHSWGRSYVLLRSTTRNQMARWRGPTKSSSRA